MHKKEVFYEDKFCETMIGKEHIVTQWDYIEDRFGKSDLLPFSISDTDFKIPVPITQQLEKVLQHQIFGYTRWNHDDFKTAIQQFFKRRFVVKLLRIGLYIVQVSFIVFLFY